MSHYDEENSDAQLAVRLRAMAEDLAHEIEHGGQSPFGADVDGVLSTLRTAADRLDRTAAVWVDASYRLPDSTVVTAHGTFGPYQDRKRAESTLVALSNRLDVVQAHIREPG